MHCILAQPGVQAGEIDAVERLILVEAGKDVAALAGFRVDMRLQTLGAAAATGESRHLKGNKYMMYRGVAERCDLVLKAIDGFDDDEPKGNPRDREALDDETMVLTLWFASPAEGLPSVPVMASAESDYGGLRIYLARAVAADIPTEGQRAEAR